MTWSVPPGFSWSATRAGALADCPRAYFYQYYLANGRAPGAEPAEVAEAARLKHLASLPTWIGSHVHDTIERLLRRARAGAETAADAAIAAMVDTMRREYRDSRDDVARQTRQYRVYRRFHEHEYGREVPRDTWAERVEDAKRMVHACVNRGYVERVRALGPKGVRALEELQDWPLDGVKVYVKIDLAFEDDDRVHVLDWKTGFREHGETPLQMMGYALFAMRRWNVDMSRLDVREVYLRQDDPERPCRVDERSLGAAEETMRASIGTMLAALDDPEHDAARADRLPPTPNPRRCPHCNYLRLCHDGRDTR